MEAWVNGKLISCRIRWIKETSFLRVDDAFILTQRSNTKEGKWLGKDYLLKEIKYPIGVNTQTMSIGISRCP